MIRHLELKAYGKINLGLDVVRRREDGYHEVRMIMQTVRVYDAIELNRTEEEGIRLSTNLYYLPDNENNLGYRAAKLLMDEFGICDGVEIKMKKFIPVAAGMAGGSSDAAAVLFGVNKMFGLGLSKQELMERGVRFFDTARFYTDSEEKIGYALSDVREHIYIATKTAATTAEGFWKDLETSLHNLKTDYVDIYQFHNPAVCPKPGDGSGLYEAMLEAKEQGKIRFIGITNHRMSIAEEAIESGLYDTLQFPFNYLSTEREIALAKACAEHKMGFIAMKGLSGGLLTNSAAIYAYMAQFENVLPIWGVQKESELDEFLSYIGNPPELTDELKAVIEKDQKELAGEFCRGCGYCMPCPAGIEINNCARMSLLLRRSPSAGHLSPEGQAKMKKIEDCLHCGHCKSMCPYGLDTPKLLEENYKDYKEVLAGKRL